jgi:hypothetical protein
MEGLYRSMRGCGQKVMGGSSAMKWSFLVWLFALVLLFTHSVTAQKPPFLVLNREEQQEAVHTTKQAVQWWLGRKYSNLYSLYSSAASFLNTEGFPESERKARFIKWCSAWRERNPYNSRLSEDEKIERLRTVDVSIKLLTGFVLMNMKSSYWDALTKGKWHRDTKIAFVEFHIRGRRYIQPLIREDKRWKILTIPLTFDEQMIREYEGLRGDGSDRPHLIKGGASELSPRSGNNLYDLFGVLRHPQGSAQTAWRWKTRHQLQLFAQHEALRAMAKIRSTAPDSHAHGARAESLAPVGKRSSYSLQICGAGNAFSALRVSTMSGAFSAIIAQS